MFARIGLRPRGAAARLARGMSGVPYGEMTIGVPKEITHLERRVAQTPESVGKLTKAGFNVVVQKGAGALPSFSDEAYVAAGAKIVDREAAFGASRRSPTSAAVERCALVRASRMRRCSSRWWRSTTRP